MLFSCLTPQELARFSTTDSGVYDAALSYIGRAFSIEDLLSRYFSPEEIIQFRTLQATTGTLISGSAALEFFGRVRYPEADLDLYVEHRHTALLGGWLLDANYAFEPRAQQNPRFPHVIHNPLANGAHPLNMDYAGHGVAGVYTFTKHCPYRKIEIVASDYSAIELVLNFHSTCVMNVISHSAAYCLYPYATFVQTRSLSRLLRSSQEADAEHKYQARGWHFVNAVTAQEAADSRSDFGTTIRRIGDSKCWIIKLPSNIGLPCDTLHYNSWISGHGGSNKLVVLFCRIRDDRDGYNYTAALGGGGSFSTEV